MTFGKKWRESKVENGNNQTISLNKGLLKVPFQILNGGSVSQKNKEN